MGRRALGAPNGLALWVADVIGSAYVQSGLSNRGLEKKTRENGTPLSDSYLRDRIVDKTMPLTIRDVEILCNVLGLGDAADFILLVDRTLRPINVSGMEDRQTLDELSIREPSSGAYALAARRREQIRSEQSDGSIPTSQ